MNSFRCFILITILLPFLADAQKPDPGIIRSDSAFNCKDYQQDSSPFGEGDICNSPNWLDIRLNSVYLPGFSRELIVLSFNNGKWNAKKYTVRQVPDLKPQAVSFLLPAKYNDHEDLFFQEIFDKLKSNKIFLLPDQEDLIASTKDSIMVFDGTRYVLTFKVGDAFRRYGYENPESYVQFFPRITEYGQLKEIITALKNIFYQK